MNGALSNDGTARKTPDKAGEIAAPIERAIPVTPESILAN